MEEKRSVHEVNRGSPALLVDWEMRPCWGGYVVLLSVNLFFFFFFFVRFGWIER